MKRRNSVNSYQSGRLRTHLRKQHAHLAHVVADHTQQGAPNVSFIVAAAAATWIDLGKAGCNRALVQTKSCKPTARITAAAAADEQLLEERCILSNAARA
jgi:hypothetical protein